MYAGSYVMFVGIIKAKAHKYRKKGISLQGVNFHNFARQFLSRENYLLASVVLIAGLIVTKFRLSDLLERLY